MLCCVVVAGVIVVVVVGSKVGAGRDACERTIVAVVAKRCSEGEENYVKSVAEWWG